MKLKLVTSAVLTLALFSLFIFQSFTLSDESSSVNDLWITGYVHAYNQCPQSVVQPGASYVITNITRNAVIGSGVSGSDGWYYNNVKGGPLQSGDVIRVSATYSNKVGCVRFTMPPNVGTHRVNVCINKPGSICNDEE